MKKKTWHVSYQAPERFGLCNNKGFKAAAICLNHHEHRCGPPRVAGQFPKDKASIKMHAFVLLGNISLYEKLSACRSSIVKLNCIAPEICGTFSPIKYCTRRTSVLTRVAGFALVSCPPEWQRAHSSAQGSSESLSSTDVSLSTLGSSKASAPKSRQA